MSWRDWVPWATDPADYFVPWMTFATGEGQAHGPMLRQGNGRREVLAWGTREKADAAARDLAGQTGGRYEIRVMKRTDLHKTCREYASWGSPVVAVILK